MKLNTKLLVSSTLLGLTLMFSGCSDGDDGNTTLINTSIEFVGANCVDGGTKVDIGLDDNKNGILDISEIDRTQYVCNGADGITGADGAPGADGQDGAPGADGQDGAPGADGQDGVDGLTTLISLTTLLEGDANCTAGGIKIDVGLDDDRNGTLETAEIDDTAYVCNGADALPTEEQCLLDAGGYTAITLSDSSIWLDRNLGADSSSEAGGYYQWGRGADGHENVASPTATGPVSTITPNDANFYTSTTYPYDWSSADTTLGLRQPLWQSPDSTTNTNQVCPCGYVVPSLNDFQSLDDLDRATLALAENLGWRDTGGTLQLPSDGASTYWTSDIQDMMGDNSPMIMYVLPNYAGTFGYYTGSAYYPAIGSQIRCIKPSNP